MGQRAIPVPRPRLQLLPGLRRQLPGHRHCLLDQFRHPQLQPGIPLAIPSGMDDYPAPGR